ncbi:hypothetical protein LCGC14_1475370 [marine sediment metagenome]|uniref:Uncharacterized protein n=1 Tax=marine sediment metagenome TaxID=412755 RepID=A0A0F9JX31_9ZZZZ
MSFQHTIGERVKREINIYHPEKGIRFGIVIKRYSRPEKKYANLGITLGPYPELYDVKWDDGSFEEGFLPHGIDKVQSQ